MNIRKTNSLILLLSLFFVLTDFHALCQVRPTKDIINGMEKLLTIISGYEYDKSRDWLQDFQNIMQDIYKDPEALKGTEKLMLQFIQSDATPAGKQFICKHLGTIATKKSVPILKAMLMDESTAEMALYVLEKIPDPAADKAMRTTLPHIAEKTQVAIINSLGVRRDSKSVKLLAKLIYETNPLISESALSALGSIGTDEAADILKSASNILTGDKKWQAMDAWLKCADRFVVDSNPAKALIIYEEVFNARPPAFLRKAAVKGMYTTTDEDPVDFIIKHLKSDDPDILPAIISLIYKVPDNLNAGRILNEITGLSKTDQLCLFTAIAFRGDRSVHQAVIEAINNEDPEFRKAGLKALARIGNPSDILLLAEKASTLRGAERDIARESLYTISGPEVDQAILSAIEHSDSKIKTELIRSIGDRNIISATSLLLKYSEDPEQGVRMESVESLGKIASPDDLPEMIRVLVNAQTERERKIAETAVYLVTLKMPDGANKSKDILAILPTVNDPGILNSFISILGEIGDDRDLSVLRGYLDNEDPDVQLAAIRALSVWPNSAPKDDLKAIVETTDDPRKHALALRGYITVVEADNNLSEDQKFNEIRHAYDIANNTDEQKIVLSGLGKTISFEALKFAIQLLDKKELVPEAEAAIMLIASDLSWANPRETREELKKVLQLTKNEELIRDIEELLDILSKR